MPSVTLLGGGKLAYRDAGSGRPLILVHGSPGDGRSWSRVAPRLTERYRVLMPDLPGYGGSDPPPNGPLGRTASIGMAIGALIETCGEPVRLCGHSYGGNVALHAAVSHADLVHSLMLFEPVFFRALYLAGDKQTFESAALFFAAYAERVTGGEPTAVGEMIDYWFGPGCFAQMQQSVRGFLISGAAANGVDVRAAFAERLTVEQLASFPGSVVIAYGGDSPPHAPTIAKALVELMMRARLHVIPGASHGMLDGRPDAVVDLILAEAEG
jgi:pimeloyl-ACP methyl ester carboxylesterase